MKLSYREKIILYIVIIVVTLFAGFMIFIKPKITSYKDNVKVLEQQEKVQGDIKEKINSISSKEKKVTDLKNEIQKNQEKVYSKKTQQDLDKYIYEIANKCGISIDNLSIVYEKPRDLTPYDPIAEMKKYNGTEEEPAPEENSENENEEDKGLLQLDCQEVNISFRTPNLVPVHAFYDAIDKLDKSIIIDISNVTYNTEKLYYETTINVVFYVIDIDDTK